VDVTANFNPRFDRTSDSEVDAAGWVLSRRMLQRLATRMSLLGQAIGFSIVGILIIMNRHEAGLNGLAGGSAVPIIGGISALLVAASFLVATYLHWRFCARHSAELRVRRQSARFTFSRSDPVMAFASLSS
jgi:hypothetical protein